MITPPNPIADDAVTHVLNSDELFEGAHEIIIVHKGVSYRLRITRQDKLILTK